MAVLQVKSERRANLGATDLADCLVGGLTHRRVGVGVGKALERRQGTRVADVIERGGGVAPEQRVLALDCGDQRQRRGATDTVEREDGVGLPGVLVGIAERVEQIRHGVVAVVRHQVVVGLDTCLIVVRQCSLDSSPDGRFVGLEALALQLRHAQEVTCDLRELVVLDHHRGPDTLLGFLPDAVSVRHRWVETDSALELLERLCVLVLIKELDSLIEQVSSAVLGKSATRTRHQGGRKYQEASGETVDHLNQAPYAQLRSGQRVGHEVVRLLDRTPGRVSFRTRLDPSLALNRGWGELGRAIHPRFSQTSVNPSPNNRLRMMCRRPFRPRSLAHGIVRRRGF